MRMPDAIDTTDAQGEPYPGLRSFRRDETHIFFGREDTISEMVDRLAEHRFLAVTGHSGSGKSSLVRTGLIDALERGLLVEAGTEWAVADFAPGGQPFTRLTAALAKAVGREFSPVELGLIEAKLARGPMGLVDWLDEIGFDPETNVLLLVDQFEEIFRFRQGQIGDDIDAFVQLLLASAKQPGRKERRRIYVVITMRSDFLGDCARFTDLAETINDGQFLTPRLTREQCRAAIEGPAAVYDGHVEPALVTRMLNDMGGNPDQLPLMQHVLMLLWQEARERGSKTPELTLADYQRLGGIGNRDAQLDESADAPRPSFLRRLFGRGRRKAADDADPSKRIVNGALSDHADAVLATLTPPQQAIAAGLFRALTQSEGAGGRDVRRPVRLSQAAAITGASVNDLIAVIEAFRAPGRNFLTPLPPVPLTPDTTIDISHESLIRQWVKLREWVREEFQSAEQYRYIERRAKQWKVGLGNLLARLDLAIARTWRRDEKPNKAWAERYGTAFDLAMDFLRRSERNRRWRRAVFVATSSVLALVILSTTLLAVALVAVMTSGLSYVNPSNEWSDFNVAAQSELKRDVGTETPLTIPGGRVISTGELEAAIDRGTLEGSPFLLLDVLRRANPTIYIPGSIYIEYGGDYGDFTDDTQKKLKDELGRLSKGNLNMPLVFFCIGARCWESYNAALRAIQLDYTNVYWYRGGINSWIEAHRSFPLDLSRIPRRVITQGMATIWGSTVWGGLREIVWPDPAHYYRRGIEYANKKQFDNAVSDFTKAISLDPTYGEAYVQRALAYRNKDDYIAAARDLNKAAEVDPRLSTRVQTALRNPAFQSRYHYERGLALYRKARYKEALDEFDSAAKLDPANEIAIRYRGHASYMTQDYNSAVEDYGRAITLNPKVASLYYSRALAFFELRDFRLAVEDLTEAVTLDPKYAAAYYKRGLTLAELGRSDLALKDFNTAIGLDGNQVSYFESRGHIHYQNRDYDAAISDYTSALRLRPNEATEYVYRGNSYLMKRDFDRAIADYSKALEMAPQDARTLASRADAYFQLGKLDEAESDADKAIALDPKKADAYSTRGHVRARRGDYDQAIKDLDMAVEIVPNEPLYRLFRAQMYFDKGDFAHAADGYSELVDLVPSNANAHWGRGRARIYGGNPAGAVDDMLKAAKLDPAYTYYALWLHIARLRAGQPDMVELAANAKLVDRAEWPWPLYGLFLGTIRPEALLPFAKVGKDEAAIADRVCEADFYLGIYQDSRGERDTAKRLFESVAATCPPHNLERQMAKFELQRLTGPMR